MGNHIPAPRQANQRTCTNFIVRDEFRIKPRRVFDTNPAELDRLNVYAWFQIPILARGPKDLQDFRFSDLVRQDHFKGKSVGGIARLSRIDGIVEANDAVDDVRIIRTPVEE